MHLHQGHYYMDGPISLLDMADKYGTPLYIYEGALMERQYRRICDALSVPSSRIFMLAKQIQTSIFLSYLSTLEQDWTVCLSRKFAWALLRLCSL